VVLFVRPLEIDVFGCRTKLTIFTQIKKIPTVFEDTLEQFKRNELVDKISQLEENLTNTKALQQNEKAREEKQRECDKKVRHLGSTNP
jgi:hypothetical protein